MFSRNSPVYWAFRIYAVCTIATAVLHATAWLRKDPALHRTANYVLLTGLTIGFLPLLGVVIHAVYVKLRRRQSDE